MQDFLNSNISQANAIANKIDTHQLDMFTKTEVSMATGISYDKISDDAVKSFLSEDTPASKIVLTKIENHVKELSNFNPHIQNFDVSTHGKYAVLGGVGASILSTTQTEASVLPKTHILSDTNKYDSLSKTEQIGANIGAGFNALNTLQAHEEFKAGASKSAKDLPISLIIEQKSIIESVKSFCKERDEKQHEPEKSLGMQR